MKALKVIWGILKVFIALGIIALIPVMLLVGVQTSAPQTFQAEEASIPDFSTTTSFSKVKADLDAFLNSDPVQAKSQNELIPLSARAYKSICETMKSTRDVYSFVDCKTTMFPGTIMEIVVQGNRFTLKKDTEYYFTEYSIPGNTGLSGLAGAFSKENTTFALRTYTNANMDYTYREKSYSPTFKVDENNVTVGIECDWSEGNRVPENLYKTESGQAPFCTNIKGEYFITDQNITEDTIKSASVEYVKSESGNFYRFVIELDTDNPVTTERSIDNLRAGGGAKARYTAMTETIEIWESGYLKYFKSVDAWQGSNVITINSVIDYTTYFFYDAKYMNPSSYLNFEEVKNAALEYDANR